MEQLLIDRAQERPSEGEIRSSSGARPQNSGGAIRSNMYPLSPGQERMWFLEQLNPGLAVYNEAVAVRLFGELKTEAMERAINIIIARQEILRTTIQMVDSRPMALVHAEWVFRLKKIDLSAMALAEREAEVRRLLLEQPRQPYNLVNEPGFRVTLLRLGSGEHIFIFMTHHIVSDWYSLGVFWRELASLYRALVTGEAPLLPSLTMQYRDYSVQQGEQAVEAGVDKDLAYWEENLRDAPRLLELPADRTRSPKPSYAGARERIILDSTLTKSLHNLSQKVGTSLFTVFASTLNTLFHRYTQKDDIVVGVPVSDRDRKDLQQLVGFILQTQVLRTKLSGDITFRTLLSRTQKQLLRLHIHRSAPFDHVVRRIQPERDLSYPTLFQVMLSWRERDQLPSFIGLDGLRVRMEFAECGTSKFDLTVFVTDMGDEIWLEMEYSTDLFDAARVAQMLGHYRVLLEQVAENPDRPVGALPLLTPAESRQLAEWNRTEFDYPRDCTVDQLIEAQAERTPDTVAARFGANELTYRVLNERASRLAAHLQSLGVGPNVAVGICAERSLEMLVGLLAILKAGGAYVPLDPAYPADRLAFVVNDCRPRVLLTQKKLQNRLPSHQAAVVCLDAPVPGAVDPPDTTGRNPRDLAYVLYTSGSTGKPKGVQVSHRAFVNLLASMEREPGLTSSDTLLAITTLSFDIAGLELFLPLIAGACVVIAPRETTLDGASLAALMEASGATVMQATPATWRMLLDAGWKGNARLKILCGGEAWPASLAAELLPRSDSLWNMYGPTETTIWSAVARLEPGQPVLIGRPIANTLFHVLDANFQLMPAGIPGELYIGGEGLAEGYLNRPDLTAERFVPDPFSHASGARLYRTGDVVRRTPDGRLEFLHRADQQVKIRGFRIELEEVESVLKQHPGVAQCVAVARDDIRGDKQLVAYLVPRDPARAHGSAELRGFLKAKLPDYMIPGAFVAVDHLPLTPNGKIDRKALAARKVLAEREPAAVQAQPRTAAESVLTRIWQEILGAAVPGIRDNFFDLGGHSLLAVRLFAQVEKAFGVRLPLATLYEAPTIEGLARILEEQGASARWKSLVAIQPSGSRPPLFCFHGAGGNVLIYRKLSQHLGPDQPFYALQSRGLDGASAPLETIEEMAALYVGEIRGVQPHGPYFLGGYCLGGSIAYEVAQQLHAAGEQVALLALFDTSNWHKLRFTYSKRASLWVQRLLFHTAVLLDLDFEGQRAFLKGKLDDLKNRIPVWLGSLLKSARRSQADPASALLARIWHTNHQASAHYIPKPYPGPVTDFRPAHQYAVLKRPGLKWEHLALGGQKVVLVPGYPGVMLVEPFVGELAGTLKEAIDAAETRPPEIRLPAELPLQSQNV